MRKRKPDLEHIQQVQVINWCELNKKKYPCLDKIYAIPNQGGNDLSSIIRGKKMEAEGLKKGMLDLCLPWPLVYSRLGELNCDVYLSCGLYIEMKVKPHGRLSPEQKEWLAYFIEVGYEAKVAWSADEAIKHLKDYINPDETKWIDFN